MNPSNPSITFQALPDELPPSFCILTAWPAETIPDSPAERNELHQSLARQIDGRSFPKTNINILSRDGSRGKPGWAVECSPEDGIELVRGLGQKTIYFVENNELYEIQCHGGGKSHMGGFERHLHNPRNFRLFTIYLGSPSPRARLSPEQDYQIRKRITTFFDSFTLSEAEGYFRNDSEETLLITAATDCPKKVLKLASDLLEYTGQQGVGVAYNGIYQRVTAWSDPDFILRVWTI